MTKDNPFQITRRRALAGLGTIGLASAGAGLGTSALFSDTESFTDNTITAGTLDMTVTASVEAANQYWQDNANLEQLSATADGDAVTGLQVSDVKPGDWGIICFDISIADNPGYLMITTENLVSEENGYTEPEGEDNDGNGELEDAILATIWHNYDGSGDRTGLSGLDSTTNVADGNQPVNWDPSRSEGGQVSSDVHYTTLKEAFDTYSTGVTYGGSAEPIPVDDTGITLCLLLEIPEEVGNEIQSDGLSFDLMFAAEQVRNNDDPFNSTTSV